ncbi:MAG: ABC transporter ATP-binding protein/permease [Candidatus Omnitrophica bacterium]|nr:ABC transporter ATP-binding protein/permease [Candidatus Omnitrophota bacterium]MCM8802064.1 ABC transporter ATP-binding protein/permease [Candidatus Omnitrophota bacterium]
MIKEYLKLRNYIKIHWKYVCVGGILSIFYIILNFLSFTSVIPLIDRILSGRRITLPENLPEFIGIKIEPLIERINSYHPLLVLKYLIVFIILTFLFKGICFYFSNLFFRLFSTKIQTDIRDKVYNKFLNLSLDFYTYTQTGELTTRVVYDIGLLNYVFEIFLPNFIFPIFLVISYLSIIFIIDWQLSFVSILIYPVILIPVMNWTKKLRNLGRIIQETYGRIGNFVNESVFGQRIIKAYNLEQDRLRKFREENESIFRTIISINKRLLLIEPFTDLCGAVATGLIIFYAGNKILTGVITPGFLSLFFFGLFSIISPLKGIMQTYAHIKHASSVLPRLFFILDYKTQVKDEGKKIFDGLKKKIEFKNVGFSYNSNCVLKNINLCINKGDKIGIVGKTGSGKSTLVSLLLRFFDPTEGEILIDGQNIKDFKLSSLRKHIGYVPQESVIFYGTIKENITFGEDDEERFKQVIETVGISKFINELPEKENSIIGERGINLSGGQKQLISIARAIYRNPEILIFDEATASLDSESEKIVQKAIDKIMEGKTVFIVAHRLSTIKEAKKIIVLENGEIVEEGTHSELYERKGVYYKFLTLQQI